MDNRWSRQIQIPSPIRSRVGTTPTHKYHNTLILSHLTSRWFSFYTHSAHGRVFKAVHLDTGFVLAIKCIAMPQATVEEAAPQIETLRKEISILRRCRSEDIVSYYGVCFRGNSLWVCKNKSSLSLSPAHTYFPSLCLSLTHAPTRSLTTLPLTHCSSLNLNDNADTKSIKIMMECCDMGSVLDVMRKVGVKFIEKEADIAFILKAVVKGLMYIHDMKVVHRYVCLSYANLFTSLWNSLYFFFWRHLLF